MPRFLNLTFASAIDLPTATEQQGQTAAEQPPEPVPGLLDRLQARGRGLREPGEVRLILIGEARLSQESPPYRHAQLPCLEPE